MKRVVLGLFFCVLQLSVCLAQSDYKLAGPYEVVARDGECRKSKAGSERDMWQAWQRAQQGDKATAINIISAYARTLQRFDGHDAPLCTIQAYWLLRAMTIMKLEAKSEKLKVDLAQWEAMVRRAFLPTVDKFEANSPYANGNWGHIVNRCRMAAAIFLEDKALYHHAVNIYLHANDNGSLPNYVGETGQCQETGRDQGHATMAVVVAAQLAQSAWALYEDNPTYADLDYFSADNNALLRMAEYNALANLKSGTHADITISGGTGVQGGTWLYAVDKIPFTAAGPWCSNSSHEAGKTQTKFGDQSRGQLRPGYEIFYKHYKDVAGSYFVKKFAEVQRPECGTGDPRYGSNSGAFDQIGWGTLMLYQ